VRCKLTAQPTNVQSTNNGEAHQREANNVQSTNNGEAHQREATNAAGLPPPAGQPTTDTDTTTTRILM